MANVINKTTKQYLTSVHTPDYSAADWIINPALPAVDKKYWKIVGNLVKSMTVNEKKAVDDAAAVKDKLSLKERYINEKNRDIAIEALKVDGVLDSKGDLIV